MDYVTRQFILLAKKLRKELRQALQKQTDAIRQSTKAAHENKQDPLPMPLPVIAELKIPEAKETQRTQRENRAHWVQVWLAAVTTCTFVAAAIYAGIAGGQWADLRHQTNLIDMNARRERRDAALQLLVAQEANRQNALIFAEGNRPWLYISAEQAQMVVGQPVAARLHIVNVGHSPAVSITSVLAKVTLVGPRGSPRDGEKFLEKLVIPDPGEGTDVMIPTEPTTTEVQPRYVIADGDNLTATDRADLDAGRLKLIAWGRVNYRSPIDLTTKHYTEFCWYHAYDASTPNTPGMWSTCISNNQMK
jgi:hypothetical protein